MRWFQGFEEPEGKRSRIASFVFFLSTLTRSQEVSMNTYSYIVSMICFFSSDAVGDIFLHDLLRFSWFPVSRGLATCDKAIVAQPHQLDTGHRWKSASTRWWSPGGRWFTNTSNYSDNYIFEPQLSYFIIFTHHISHIHIVIYIWSYEFSLVIFI